MTNQSILTFNKLYPRIKSVISSYSGTSFTIKTFFDGSAVVNVVIFYGNKSVDYSCLVKVNYSESGEVVGCNLVDDNKIQNFDKIEQCVGSIKSTVVKTRTYLSRIRN